MNFIKHFILSFLLALGLVSCSSDKNEAPAPLNASNPVMGPGMKRPVMPYRYDDRGTLTIDSVPGSAPQVFYNVDQILDVSHFFMSFSMNGVLHLFHRTLGVMDRCFIINRCEIQISEGFAKVQAGANSGTIYRNGGEVLGFGSNVMGRGLVELKISDRFALYRSQSGGVKIWGVDGQVLEDFESYQNYIPLNNRSSNRNFEYFEYNERSRQSALIVELTSGFAAISSKQRSVLINSSYQKLIQENSYLQFKLSDSFAIVDSGGVPVRNGMIYAYGQAQPFHQFVPGEGQYEISMRFAAYHSFHSQKESLLWGLNAQVLHRCVNQNNNGRRPQRDDRRRDYRLEDDYRRGDDYRRDDRTDNRTDLRYRIQGCYEISDWFAVHQGQSETLLWSGHQYNVLDRSSYPSTSMGHRYQLSSGFAVGPCLPSQPRKVWNQLGQILDVDQGRQSYCDNQNHFQLNSFFMAYKDDDYGSCGLYHAEKGRLYFNGHRCDVTFDLDHNDGSAKVISYDGNIEEEYNSKGQKLLKQWKRRPKNRSGRN